MSPSLIQGYVAAAMKISRQAVGDRTAAPSQVTYSAPGRLAQDKHIEGLPLGTRGGLLVTHTFPLDAEYEFCDRRRRAAAASAGSTHRRDDRRRAGHGAQPAQLPRRRSPPARTPSAWRSSIGSAAPAWTRASRTSASTRRSPRRGGVQTRRPSRARSTPRAPATRRASKKMFVCRPATAARGGAVRAPDRLDAGAPRLPAPGHRPPTSTR